MKVQSLGRAKVKKWKPFMSGGEIKRWKREGGSMLKMKKSKKVWW